MKRLAIAAIAAGTTLAAAAEATETIAYRYDARGRLIQVTHAGGANNGANATYSLDKADNRLSVTVTGAQSTPSPSPPPAPAPSPAPTPPPPPLPGPDATSCLAAVQIGGAYRLITCSPAT